MFGKPSRQGSKIPGRSAKTGKLFVREEAGQALKDWRANVRECAIAARDGQDMMTGALRLTVVFFVPRPKSVSVSSRPLPTVAPDLDKMVRAVGDALKEAAVYKDDSQIIEIIAAKHYATEKADHAPGAWIKVGPYLS